ncbi:MAG: hypothetical protein Q8914_03170 [Bacteroidota bacterium]|nr:hypothetical protein [Bacteroidota bacterium]
MGLEYFYKKNRFININVNSASDFFLPIPAAVDMSGEYEMMSSVYLGLTDNYKFKRFTVGYGLNYSKNIWDLRYYEWGDPTPPTREPIKRASQSIGFTLNGYHQFGEHFFIGLIYRPSILRVNPTVGFNYEHLISLDVVWKIKLRK